MNRFLGLLLALGLLAGGTPAHGRQQSSPSRVSLITLHMVTVHVGWGLTERQLVRTEDGGHTWQTLHPTLQ